MPDSLRSIARHAFEAADANWCDTPTEDTRTLREYMADAVAVAVSQEWARYPQHAEDCATRITCRWCEGSRASHGNHQHAFEADATTTCSCGLDTLRADLSALSVRPEREQEEEQDHGGTRLTEGASVSGSVPAPELPHDATRFADTLDHMARYRRDGRLPEGRSVAALAEAAACDAGAAALRYQSDYHAKWLAREIEHGEALRRRTVSECGQIGSAPDSLSEASASPGRSESAEKELSQLGERDAAQAASETDGWAKWLKDGETPLERIEREHRDNQTLLRLLAKCRAENAIRLEPDHAETEASVFERLTVGELLDGLDEAADWIDAHGTLDEPQTPWLIHRDVVREALRRLQVGRAPVMTSEASSSPGRSAAPKDHHG